MASDTYALETHRLSNHDQYDDDGDDGDQIGRRSLFAGPDDDGDTDSKGDDDLDDDGGDDGDQIGRGRLLPRPDDDGDTNSKGDGKGGKGDDDLDNDDLDDDDADDGDQIGRGRLFAGPDDNGDTDSKGDEDLDDDGGDDGDQINRGGFFSGLAGLDDDGDTNSKGKGEGGKGDDDLDDDDGADSGKGGNNSSGAVIISGSVYDHTSSANSKAAGHIGGSISPHTSTPQGTTTSSHEGLAVTTPSVPDTTASTITTDSSTFIQTKLPSPTRSPSNTDIPDRSRNMSTVTGIVLGGVIGAVACTSILILIVWVTRRRWRAATAARDPEKQAHRWQFWIRPNGFTLRRKPKRQTEYCKPELDATDTAVGYHPGGPHELCVPQAGHEIPAEMNTEREPVELPADKPGFYVDSEELDREAS